MKKRRQTLRMSNLPPEVIEDIRAELEQLASDYRASLNKRNAAEEHLEARRRQLEGILQAIYGEYGEATGLQVSLSEGK